MSNSTWTGWRNYIKKVALAELREQPPMGGVGEVVQIDECPMRGQRKANRDGVSNEGPWIFGMLCVSTKELRLFDVDKRDAAAIGSLIVKNILPGTTVYTDEGAAYQCIPTLKDANDRPLNLDWHTVNHSVDPATGANTQHIQSEWRKAKCRLVRYSKKTSPSLMPSHLAWLWWRSINARPNVKDPFLRLMEAIARRCPV
uniref:Protein ovary overexpressed n=1 Tax=Rhipicephalus microplus TaxID=6941 RepID=A0A6M2CUC0_RHIMP